MSKIDYFVSWSIIMTAITLPWYSNNLACTIVLIWQCMQSQLMHFHSDHDYQQ